MYQYVLNYNSLATILSSYNFLLYFSEDLYQAGDTVEDKF